MRKNVVAEITEIKSRQGQLHRVAIETRVDHLEREWNSVTQKSTAVAAFVPIGLVTCIEVFFRSFMADLIDFGSPYAERSEALFQGKVGLDTIHANSGTARNPRRASGSRTSLPKPS